MTIPDSLLNQCIKDAIGCIDKRSKEVKIVGINNIKNFEENVNIIINQYFYKGEHEPLKNHILDQKCSQQYYKNKILVKALNSLKYINNFDHIRKQLSSKIEQCEKQNIEGENKEWYFIFPLNFNLKCRGGKVQQEFEIYGKELKLLNFYDFKKSEFWSEEVNTVLKKQFIDYRNLNKYSWLIINELGKDSGFAYEQAINILNKFLGVVNFSRWSMTDKWIESNQYPGSISCYTDIISPSHALRYNNNRRYEYSILENGLTVSKFEEFNDNYYNTYGDLVKTFEDLSQLDKTGKAYSTIFDVLEIFHLALNNISYDLGFLYLWVGLEKMTFRRRSNRKDLTYKEMIDRIMNVVTSDVSKIRLEEIEKKRHILVHAGEYNIISLDDFNLIKYIFSLILYLLINNNNEFRTLDDIENFYTIMV